ncbi:MULTISPECIES: hypothetical protein [unclassified Sporosarcina]|uniref:hypothetical protein n=1 Tax=unclassified Sporosarcina TaxID=2647733 RepID=UPI001648C7D9|nr:MULTISPECIES: hypothetical protein [unclassified Sporosarcina]MBO0589533.1 hypothetical protein [Sporosarcina sp. E16_8]
MEENDKGILYINMFIGTLGLIIIIVGLLKYYETVGGIGSSFALLGFPLTMIYMNYLEGKAGISKKILWIKSIIAIFLLFIISIYFN